MQKLLLFFIDGLGLGADDPINNPMRDLFSDLMGGERLIKREAPLFFPNGVLVPTDALIGVPGIPQSATGQTSIFTGINAQRKIGRHLPAFPNTELKRLIEERSLMKALQKEGIKTTAANLYSEEFFLKRQNSRRNLFPVSTLTIKASGCDFRYPEDYKAGRAVFADITNSLIRKRGYEIELIQPEEAAGNMQNILSDYDFVFFEYFMTDLYGHKRNIKGLMECLDVLNRFVGNLWNTTASVNTDILIVSDHGNAEDLSTSDHTTNKVPTLLLSRNKRNRELFAGKVKNLTDIYYTIIEYFTDRGS